MSISSIYPIGEVSVVDLVGADASQILHNLTTNDIKKLTTDSGCETFITDVRGKTLGHVCAFRLRDGFRLIGAPGQSESLAAHADRYTIREDATPTIRDNEFVAFVMHSNETIDESQGQASSDDVAKLQSRELSDWPASSYQVNWVGSSSEVILLSCDRADDFLLACRDKGMTQRSLDEFHADRIRHRFPWYGIDLTEKNLPQEADRNGTTISFTKGCYLGQETVARLDALGQVQKKLVIWSIEGGVPDEGTELLSDEKVVGRLTSIAATSDKQAIAIGVARRSHFESGATAQGKLNDVEGTTITATVVETGV